VSGIFVVSVFENHSRHVRRDDMMRNLLGRSLGLRSSRGLSGLFTTGSSRLASGFSLGGGPESLGSELVIGFHVMICSTYQVITEKLHNKSGVLVAFLAEGVEF